MSRTASVLSLATAIALAAPALSQAQSVMTQHMRTEVRSGIAPMVAQLPPNQVMNLDIVLPLRDAAGLKTLLSQLYDPASPSFHKFLTVEEFTARFGPTQEDYDSVVAYAKASGLTVTGGSRDGMEVQAKGPVSAVESAFHVKMATYQRSSGQGTFYAPDREPTANLHVNLWHVSGLDNFSTPHPLLSRKSD